MLTYAETFIKFQMTKVVNIIKITVSTTLCNYMEKPDITYILASNLDPNHIFQQGTMLSVGPTLHMTSYSMDTCGVELDVNYNEPMN